MIFASSRSIRANWRLKVSAQRWTETRAVSQSCGGSLASWRPFVLGCFGGWRLFFLRMAGFGLAWVVKFLGIWSWFGVGLGLVWESQIILFLTNRWFAADYDVSMMFRSRASRFFMIGPSDGFHNQSRWSSHLGLPTSWTQTIAIWYIYFWLMYYHIIHTGHKHCKAIWRTLANYGKRYLYPIERLLHIEFCLPLICWCRHGDAEGYSRWCGPMEWGLVSPRSNSTHVLDSKRHFCPFFPQIFNWIRNHQSIAFPENRGSISERTSQNGWRLHALFLLWKEHCSNPWLPEHWHCLMFLTTWMLVMTCEVYPDPSSPTWTDANTAATHRLLVHSGEEDWQFSSLGTSCQETFPVSAVHMVRKSKMSILDMLSFGCEKVQIWYETYDTGRYK